MKLLRHIVFPVSSVTYPPWLNVLVSHCRNHGHPVANQFTEQQLSAEEGVEDYYRINVFNAAIDAVLMDFRARFSQHARLSAGLNCLLPNLIHEKTWADVKDAFAKYSGHLLVQLKKLKQSLPCGRCSGKASLDTCSRQLCQTLLLLP